MKNLTPNQKVVFKLEPICKILRCTREFAISVLMEDFKTLPKENEVLTVEITRGAYCALKEYMFTDRQTVQLFHESVLFPLSEISKQETEKITADLEKSFLREHETTIFFKRLFN